MLDAKKIAETEQAVAHLRETMPLMLFGIYSGCIKEGFTPTQAMQIVIANVHGMHRGARDQSSES